MKTGKSNLLDRKSLSLNNVSKYNDEEFLHHSFSSNRMSVQFSVSMRGHRNQKGKEFPENIPFKPFIIIFSVPRSSFLLSRSSSLCFCTFSLLTTREDGERTFCKCRIQKKYSLRLPQIVPTDASSLTEQNRICYSSSRIFHDVVTITVDVEC